MYIVISFLLFFGAFLMGPMIWSLTKDSNPSHEGYIPMIYLSIYTVLFMLRFCFFGG